MQDAAAGEKSGLLLPGGETGCAARADVDFPPAVMSEEIGFGRSLGERDHGHPLSVIDFDLFIKRQHHGVEFGAEDRVHHQFFEIGALNAGDSPVVFEAEEDQAPRRLARATTFFWRDDESLSHPGLFLNATQFGNSLFKLALLPFQIPHGLLVF